METNAHLTYPTVAVSGNIKLGQFLKLANLVEDGSQARGLIQAGDVKVNNIVETRRGKTLSTGDLVIVDLPWGESGATVG